MAGFRCGFDRDDALKVAIRLVEAAWVRPHAPLLPVDGKCMSVARFPGKWDRPHVPVLMPDGKRITVAATRVIWEAFRGPLTPELVVDHLCMREWCINILHLDACTRSVNAKRAYAAHGMSVDGWNNSPI